MNLKIDKELFDERVYGGFEPSDPDDETFLLNKLGQYPGELPYKIESTQTEINFLDQIDLSEQQKNIEEEVSTTETIGSEQDQIETASFESFDQAEKNERVQFQPTERETIIGKEVREPIPYEKAGIEKDEREPIPYKKSGLIEDEETLPYQRSRDLIREAKAFETEQATSPKSIWDIFQEGQASSTTPEQVTSETSEVTAEAKETQIAEQTSSETTDVTETKEPKTQTILIGSDSIVDIPLEIKIEEIPQEELSKIFDDDFRKTILEDLEKSQKRREEKNKQKEEVLSTSEKEELQRELNQYDETQPSTSEVVEIDLSSIEIEKPSQIIAKELIESGELKKTKKRKKEKKRKTEESKPQETTVEETEPQPSVVEFETESPQEQEEEKPTEEKSEEEKKKRKIPVLWLGVASGLALIVLVIGGYLLYQNLFAPKEKPKETAKKEVPAKQPISEKPVEHKVEKPQTTEPEKQPLVAETKPEQKVEQPTPKIVKIPSEPKITEKKEPEKQIVTKEIPEKKEPPPQTKVAKEEKPIIAKKVVEPTTKQTQRQLKIPQEVKIVETVQEEYSIEILSTADPEEAGYWLNQLQQRGINAYQKVHRIRNVPYYKIRIGTYKTIEEAKSVARALGFKNVWIDRVK